MFRLGVFKPDERAAWELFEKASKKFIETKSVKLLLVADSCCDAIINSAMALLMKLGIKTTPEKIYGEIVRNLVDRRILDREMAEWVEEIRRLRKSVERGEIRELTGEEIDLWINRADTFISKDS